MNYSIKNIDLHKLVSTSALLLMMFLIAWFFYHSSVNSLEHGDYIDAFVSQCESDGGSVSLPKDSSGWPQPECHKNGTVVNIK